MPTADPRAPKASPPPSDLSAAPAKFIRLPAVMDRTGYSRPSIYRKMRRGEFPQNINLGGKAVAWTESSITEWMNERIQASRDASPR
jgi:prophage regulatory protein